MKNPKDITHYPDGLIKLSCEDVEEIIRHLKEENLELDINIDAQFSCFYICAEYREGYYFNFECDLANGQVVCEICDQDTIPFARHVHELVTTDARFCPITDLMILEFGSIEQMQEIIDAYYKNVYSDFYNTFKKKKHIPKTSLSLVPPPDEE